MAAVRGDGRTELHDLADEHGDSSATKTDASIIPTPQTVSVVAPDFIDALNVRTIAEAARNG